MASSYPNTRIGEYPVDERTSSDIELELQRSFYDGDTAIESRRASSDSRGKSSLIEHPVHETPVIRRVLVTFQLSGINFTTCAVNGLVCIGLPAITHDLHISDSLAVWPSCVTSLTTAATLLLAGTVADLVGSRPVQLFGAFSCALLMLAAGAANSGSLMVGLRAIQGISLSCHLAASVALVTQSVPSGRGRNIAFSCLGLSQPLGFSFGLVLGGILVDSVGWRSGWYIYGGITLALAIMGIFVLPPHPNKKPMRTMLRDLRTEIDWVGALLISCFMGAISTFLAILSTGIENISRPETIILLCLSAMLLPCFIAWVRRQVQAGKPALIPNALWKIPSFSAVTVMIALSFAVLNALELFCSLFFQEIQSLSALEAAIRILPSLIIGTILNVTTGLFVHKVPAFWLAIIPTGLSAVAPLLMATSEPARTYWSMHFVAQLFQPISSDILFTVGLIVITEVFPEDKHALAGAVFNTSAQFGNAFGLAIMQVVLTLVTTRKESELPVLRAKLEGYRAGFWTMFALMLVCVVVGGVGFWKVGKIGVPKDEKPEEKEGDVVATVESEEFEKK